VSIQTEFWKWWYVGVSSKRDPLLIWLFFPSLIVPEFEIWKLPVVAQFNAYSEIHALFGKSRNSGELTEIRI
jgi:hypothetical protein